jgi:hypothetical protein
MRRQCPDYDRVVQQRDEAIRDRDRLIGELEGGIAVSLATLAAERDELAEQVRDLEALHREVGDLRTVSPRTFVFGEYQVEVLARGDVLVSRGGYEVLGDLTPLLKSALVHVCKENAELQQELDGVPER